MQILINKAECLTCKDVIESKHRHDYVTCSCGSISVDGGRDYLKRRGEPSSLNELSVYDEYDDIDEEIYQYYIDCLDNNEGDEYLAVVETADNFIEDEDFIETIVNKFRGNDNA